MSLFVHECDPTIKTSKKKNGSQDKFDVNIKMI